LNVFFSVIIPPKRFLLIKKALRFLIYKLSRAPTRLLIEPSNLHFQRAGFMDELLKQPSVTPRDGREYYKA